MKHIPRINKIGSSKVLKKKKIKIWFKPWGFKGRNKPQVVNLTGFFLGQMVNELNWK